MISKEQLIGTLDSLPSSFTAEEIIERILLLEKIQIGVEQANNGEVVQDDQLDQHLRKWLD